MFPLLFLLAWRRWLLRAPALLLMVAMLSLDAIPHATVVYSARSPAFIESSLFDNGEGGRETNYVAAPEAEREAQFPARAGALRNTLEGLAAVSITW